ncbi:hypothetical protein TNCV_3546971 [Trichonephila clavipes]|nr:hypothetical protein TNCV_3546971 [Trichonephila clavipes]
MALYRSPLTVTLWPSSFLKKYGPMIPPAHKAHQNKQVSPRPPDSPERLGNGLSGNGGLLVSSQSLLAEDRDRSGTATSVDGTPCTEDEPTLVQILRNIFRRFCMLNIRVVFSNL